MMQREPRYAYMCETDYLHELGDALPDTRLYPSVEALQKTRECCGSKGACGIVKVEVRQVELVRAWDASREPEL